MDIKQLLEDHLDRLLAAHSANSSLTIDDIVTIGAQVAAGALRGRFKAEQEVNPVEVHGVFGIIGDFYKRHFGDHFTAVDFEALQSKALSLLQEKTFDADHEAFIHSLLK